MISIEYESGSNKFIIQCGFNENAVVMGMPDRRFRKRSRTWAAPVLRRNIQYMAQHMSNPQMYSQEALKVFNEKRAESTKKPTGANEFPAWFDFKNSPLKHQGEGLQKFFPLNEAAIFFEQGLGKTFTGINLVAAWRMTNQIDSVVVICPSSIKLVWQEELDKHCPIPTQRHVIQSGKYKAATKFIDEKDDFQWLMAGVEGMSQGSAHEYVKRFMLGRRCAIIIDESSSIKTPGKTRTDRCVEFGTMAVKKIALSGTSITQGLEDLYTQFKYLNPEIIGFDSFYTFRAHFCVTATIEVKENKFIQKIVGYKNEDEFMKLIGPYTMRAEKIDCLDLPPKTFTNRYITMNPTQKRLYNEMKHELIVEMDGREYEVTTGLEKMLRLQQITGGHYPFDDGEKVTARPIPGVNPKIKELLNIVNDVSGKIVIWCQFRPEIAVVAQALDKAGVGVRQFHGGCNDDEKKKAVKDFRSDAGVKVFLATRAAAFGLTMTEASTAIYYSQGYSLEQYAQSQDRIHRIGQNDPCNYIHLTCDKSIDTDIINALAGKKSIADLMYSLMKD